MNRSVIVLYFKVGYGFTRDHYLTTTICFLGSLKPSRCTKSLKSETLVPLSSIQRSDTALSITFDITIT